MKTSDLIKYYHKPPEIGHSYREVLYKIAGQRVTCYYQKDQTYTLRREAWSGRRYLRKYTKLSREEFELKLAAWSL